MRVERPRWMDHKWQSYWRCDEEGHADCGIFYEPTKGHAYALLRAPKYITHEEWDEIREHVVRACNSHEALVALLREAYADYSNPRFTDRHGFADRAKAVLDTLK